MSATKYVLITAARNEEQYIEKPIESVINQTLLPEAWIIVSDGSTDRTDEIVTLYSRRYNYIKLLKMKSEANRNFASKVFAIKAAYKQLISIPYDYIGILDADISLPPSYYELILNKFSKNPSLGLAGGQIYDVINDKEIKSITRLNRSVSGAIQMFRRNCFNDIGGFHPQRLGGEDVIAEYAVRMYGWKVETFPEVNVLHHRRMGTESQSIWKARFIQGIRDYTVGYHPLYETMKCIRRIVERPYALGAFFWLSGFFYAFFSKKWKSVLPEEVIRYIRKEQMDSLFKNRK